MFSTQYLVEMLAYLIFLNLLAFAAKILIRLLSHFARFLVFMLKIITAFLFICIVFKLIMGDVPTELKFER